MKPMAKDVAGRASQLYRSLETSGSYEGWPLVVTESFEIGDWGFERARLSAAPHTAFDDSWHGWKAVPFQNSDAQSFSATSFRRAASKNL